MRLRASIAVGVLVLLAANAAAASPEFGTRAVSQDGSTAVRLQSGPTSARLTVVDRSSGQVKRGLTLHGDYSLDAISPDGRTVYVIRYLSTDRAHYAVQWIDTERARAVPHTVVEKGEPGEEMAGNAIGRVSKDEWVYTLYDGAGHTPFVHALNTAERFTVCIDLDALEGRGDLASLGLRLGSQHLAVLTAAGRPLVYVDPGTFNVTEAKAAPVVARPPAPATQARSSGDGPSWWLLAVVAGVLALVLAAVRRRSTRVALAREAHDPDRAAASAEVADGFAGAGAAEVAHHHLTVP